jgi:hypothetical protein
VIFAQRAGPLYITAHNDHGGQLLDRKQLTRRTSVSPVIQSLGSSISQSAATPLSSSSLRTTGLGLQITAGALPARRSQQLLLPVGPKASPEAHHLLVLPGAGREAQADGSRVPSMAAWATSVRRRLWLRA